MKAWYDSEGFKAFTMEVDEWEAEIKDKGDFPKAPLKSFRAWRRKKLQETTTAEVGGPRACEGRKDGCKDEGQRRKVGKAEEGQGRRSKSLYYSLSSGQNSVSWKQTIHIYSP